MQESKIITEILSKIDSRLDVISAKRQLAESTMRYTDTMTYDRAWEEIKQLKQDVEKLLQESATTGAEA